MICAQVRGKNGRAEADLSSSELYAAKRALISCLQSLPDEERLAKEDRHGLRGCEFEASMDWLSREEGAPILSSFRDSHRDELRETVDQFRLTASKMGKAVLIANATLKAKDAFDRACLGFPASDPPEPCIAAAERAADGAAVAAEAAVIEAAEGDDASFTRSHIAALTDETKAAIREWARLRLSRGSTESNDCGARRPYGAFCSTPSPRPAHDEPDARWRGGAHRSRAQATGARSRPSRRNVPTRRELGVDRPGNGCSWRRRLCRRRSRLS